LSVTAMSDDKPADTGNLEDKNPELEKGDEKVEDTLKDEGKDDDGSKDEPLDETLEEMRKTLKEADEEIRKIVARSTSFGGTAESSNKAAASFGPEVDKRSVYVGNVEYETKPDELKEFFTPCGAVNRVTIMVNKRTGRAMGYAYVEFHDEEGAKNAVLLDEQEFKGRLLKVNSKRTNIKGFSSRGRVNELSIYHSREITLHCF